MNTIICSIFLLITIFNSNNQYFSLSFLKLILFYFGSSFSILIFGLIKNYKIIFSWMFALFANLIIFSFIMYLFFRQLGTFEKGDLFMGAFFHPNKVGMFLLPYIVFGFSMLTNQKEKNLAIYFASSAAIVLVFLSGSRGSIFHL